ncbi:MAG: hypothetical protein M1819_006835 [Sarea resinae]|nr:MAG: hypothetical protein M1819_006835 [Sarea resinae]
MSTDQHVAVDATDTSAPLGDAKPAIPAIPKEPCPAEETSSDRSSRPTTSSPLPPRPSPSELPSIHYPLTKRKWNIFRTWSLILLFSSPVSDVPPLQMVDDLFLTGHASYIFTIVTCLIGVIDVAPQLCIRAYLLFYYPFYRPLGASRFALDFFLWNLSGAFIVIAAELIVGTAPYHPLVRLLAMPAPSMLFWLGFQTLICTVMHTADVKTPIRVSSFARGERMPPGLYSYIEDIVSVDGRAGQPYRQALRARFEASPVFRAMLIRLSFFWSVPAIVLAAALTAIIFAAPRDVGYAMGWSVPFAFGAIWTVLTIFHVKHVITGEKAAWAHEHDPVVVDDKETAV